MKRTVRIAGRGLFTALVVAILLLLMISPARAPKGNRFSPGGRTIASIQEEDVDKKLLSYQLCYGVHLIADHASLERRRACKVILVHKLDAALSQPGTYLSTPVQFFCEDTAIGQNFWKDAQEYPTAALRPNAEFSVIDDVMAKYLEKIPVDEFLTQRAQSVCGFVSRCKTAMKFESFSVRRIGACIFDADALRRRIMMDSIGLVLFRAKSSPDKLLVAELLRGEL